MYQPTLGQFLSRDPIGAALGGMKNIYGYTYDSPLNWVDPSGMQGEGIEFHTYPGQPHRGVTGPYSSTGTRTGESASSEALKRGLTVKRRRDTKPPAPPATESTGGFWAWLLGDECCTYTPYAVVGKPDPKVVPWREELGHIDWVAVPTTAYTPEVLPYVPEFLPAVLPAGALPIVPWWVPTDEKASEKTFRHLCRIWWRSMQICTKTCTDSAGNKTTTRVIKWGDDIHITYGVVQHFGTGYACDAAYPSGALPSPTCAGPGLEEKL